MIKRVISAIVMCAICIPAVVLGGNWFFVLAFIVGLMALYEIINVKESKKSLPLFVKIVSFLMFAATFTMASTGNDFSLDYRVICSLILSMMLPLIFYRRESYSINDAAYLIGFIFLLSSVFSMIVYIRNLNNSMSYLIYVLLIAIATDTYAYFSGKLVGLHKLIPDISPNKTIEGTVFGVILGTLVASTYYYIAISDTVNVLYLVMSTVFLCVLGQLGDLVFSAIKRYFGKKDYSDLIPGHGGILDRLDSTIFIVCGFILLLGIL